MIMLGGLGWGGGRVALVGVVVRACVHENYLRERQHYSQTLARLWHALPAATI